MRTQNWRSYLVIGIVTYSVAATTAAAASSSAVAGAPALSPAVAGSEAIPTTGPASAVGPASALDAGAYAGPGLRAAYLRCEYKANPLAVASRAPRLSWIVESGQRGQRQTAWRVLVSSSAERLARDEGDLWDSGRMTGGETVTVPYAGRPLASGQACHWKVMVWDKDGKASPWSAPAHWAMALLEAGDWKATWIGYDAPRAQPEQEADFGAAQWICHRPDATPQAPAGRRVFLKSFTIEDADAVESALLTVVADDAYSLNLNGDRVMRVDLGDYTWKRAHLQEVRQRLLTGKNEFRLLVDNAVAGPTGAVLRLSLRLRGGKTAEVVTDASWEGTDKPTAQPSNRKAWTPVRVLGAYGMAPWGRALSQPVVMPPAVQLRKEFDAGQKRVVRAMLYATALGWFDAYLNGERVNEDYFTSGWTDYRKRVYYRAYDVTARVRAGRNALGAALSDGWYSGYIGWFGLREHYGKKPRFLAQLAIEYADGTRALVVTGPDWTGGTGPVTGADILQGERYDARRERRDWARPGFAEAGSWKPVDTGAELKPALEPHPGPAVEAVALVPARSITEPKSGVYVFDLGQNFAGVVRLRVKGKPGQTITLRHAERLNPNGTVYTANLRTALATDTYTCRGGGEEVWQPRFTFHGFQYVEVTGVDSKPDLGLVTGVALSSATPPAGDFETDDALVNRLAANVRWTQAMNFIDVPTDCPQRDERMGWTGDAQVYVRTATLNTDVQAFFDKWLIDLADAQRADGQFPKVAPIVQTLEDGGPAWQEVGVICPWTIYEVYGDRQQLERHYPGMVRFIEFNRARSTAELLPPEKYHCYGDWLSIKADTPKDVIYTAYFAYAAQLTARTAEVLGKTSDAAKYRDLAERLKAAFNRAYVAADGKIKGHTQAVYVLALAFDLVDGAAAKAAATHLVADIEARGGLLSTGFIGTKDLMLVLAKIGRNDVAYRLLHTEAFPGWGFSIRHGATSIWERWDGWTPEKGFQTTGMNSFAHYSFGAVYQWMVENIGGIRNATPTYDRILIEPTPGGKLNRAKVGYRSVRGRIATEWRREGAETIRYTITVPANTTAVVALPGADAAAVTEGGKPLARAESVRLLGIEGGRVRLEVGSGHYDFVVRGR